MDQKNKKHARPSNCNGLESKKNTGQELVFEIRTDRKLQESVLWRSVRSPLGLPNPPIRGTICSDQSRSRWAREWRDGPKTDRRSRSEDGDSIIKLWKWSMTVEMKVRMGSAYSMASIRAKITHERNSQHHISLFRRFTEFQSIMTDLIFSNSIDPSCDDWVSNRRIVFFCYSRPTGSGLNWIALNGIWFNLQTITTMLTRLLWMLELFSLQDDQQVAG